jgi:hypothetical protein
VEPREAVVPAGGELSVLVHVVLDDTTKFKDVLHALVAEGADVNIPLEATGEPGYTPGFMCEQVATPATPSYVFVANHAVDM